MEYFERLGGIVCLGFTLMLGGTYVVCSFAEFFLWMFEREPSDNPTAEVTELTARSSEIAPIIRPSSHVDTVPKPGILIVDDHSRYRRLLETWFRDHGFRVWTAQDGCEAVELYRAHAEDIALALLDVHMPGLDGPATMTALHREPASIPCCLMTADLTAEHEAQLLGLGADGVFEKPLLLREATAVISSLIN